MFMFTTIMVLDGRLCTLCVWPAMSVAFGTGRQTAIAHHAFICVLFCFCLVRVCIAGQILAVETEEKWAIFTLLPRAWACDDREWDTDGLCATKTCWSCGCQFNSRAIRPALQLFCVVVGIYIYKCWLEATSRTVKCPTMNCHCLHLHCHFWEASISVFSALVPQNQRDII